MNATLVSNRQNDSDMKFQKFIQNHELNTSQEIGDRPTYQHGIGSSQIDYIFEQKSSNLIENLKILDNDPCNTSSHVPVRCQVHCSIPTVHTTHKAPLKGSRFIWDDCQTDLYQHTRYRSLNFRLLKGLIKLKHL